MSSGGGPSREGIGPSSESTIALTELIASDKATDSQKRSFRQRIRDDTMFHRNVLDQLYVYERQGQLPYCQAIRKLLPDIEPAHTLAPDMQMAYLMRNVSLTTNPQVQQNLPDRGPPHQVRGVTPQTRSDPARGAPTSQSSAPMSTQGAQGGGAAASNRTASSTRHRAAAARGADVQFPAASTAQEPRSVSASTAQSSTPPAAEGPRSRSAPATQPFTPSAAGRPQSRRTPAALPSTPSAARGCQPREAPRSPGYANAELIDLIAEDKATPDQLRSFIQKVQHDTVFQRQLLDREESYRSSRILIAYQKVSCLRNAVRESANLDLHDFFPCDEYLAAIARETWMLIEENGLRRTANMPLVDPQRESDHFRTRYPAMSQLRGIRELGDNSFPSPSEASTTRTTRASQPHSLSSPRRAAQADPSSGTTRSSAPYSLARRGAPRPSAASAASAAVASSSAARRDNNAQPPSRFPARPSRGNDPDKIWRGMFDRK